MGVDTDQLKEFFKTTLNEGLDEIVKNADETVKNELADLGTDMGQAVAAGDEATARELLTQLPVAGELNRALAAAVGREKFEAFVKGAIKIGVKLALA